MEGYEKRSDLIGRRLRTDARTHARRTVADGRALVEAALRLKPRLIVSDITMPHLNGIDAASRIKTSLPGIKLLFVTAHTSAA